jgi:hypothetical protein
LLLKNFLAKKVKSVSFYFKIVVDFLRSMLYNRGVKRKGIEMKKSTSGVFEMMDIVDEILDEIAKMPGISSSFDGELIVHDERGRKSITIPITLNLDNLS